MAMQAQQQQMQNNPVVMKTQVEMQKLQQQAQKDKAQFTVDMAKIQGEKEKVAADIQINKEASKVQLVKAMTERHKSDTDLRLKHLDMGHRHIKEAIEVHHRVRKPETGVNHNG
jgi:hypothetical protein